MHLFRNKEPLTVWKRISLPGRKSLHKTHEIPENTLLQEFYHAPCSARAVIKVVEGPFKGYERYAYRHELRRISALELLAMEAE